MTRTVTRPPFNSSGDELTVDDYVSGEQFQRDAIDEWFRDNRIALNSIILIKHHKSSVTLVDIGVKPARCVSLCDLRNDEDRHETEQHIETKIRNYPIE